MNKLAQTDLIIDTWYCCMFQEFGKPDMDGTLFKYLGDDLAEIDSNSNIDPNIVESVPYADYYISG